MSVNSYVIHFNSLYGANRFKIVKAETAEAALALFEERSKTSREIIKVEPFTTFADIQQVADKLRTNLSKIDEAAARVKALPDLKKNGSRILARRIYTPDSYRLFDLRSRWFALNFTIVMMVYISKPSCFRKISKPFVILMIFIFSHQTVLAGKNAKL